jgi:hypothetical protein
MEITHLKGIQKENKADLSGYRLTVCWAASIKTSDLVVQLLAISEQSQYRMKLR